MTDLLKDIGDLCPTAPARIWLQADPLYETREGRYIGDALWHWLLHEQQEPAGMKVFDGVQQ